MTWLTPIGFLGLIGLVALIVIYIIKPNYQNKTISSTYVWRLSLKYRKKRIPLSRLNHILLFLCQCLILTICALLLAQPVIASQKPGDENEKVIIIDASASMMASDGVNTRFERAVEQAKIMVEDTVSGGGLVSVIVADGKPDKFLAQRVSGDQLDEVFGALDALVADGTKCTYGSADLDKAVELAQEVLNYNNEAQVYLYTGTSFTQKNGIIVQNVGVEGEWNAAVLGCDAKYNENNHYEITVDLGCFGRTEQLTVYCEVHGANGRTDKVAPYSKSEFFDPTEEEKRVVFTTDDFGGQPLYSFDYLEVYVSVADSFAEDNFFFLYGGKKPTIRVQYASSIPNNYFAGIVRTMRETMKNQWKIEFVECKADEKGKTEGFDLYIFEHRMPDVMPTDGVVLLVDPNKAPDGSGLRIGQAYAVNSDTTLASGVTHDLMKYADPGRVTVSKYIDIQSHDNYEELAYYNGRPMILAKNEPQAKVVVWAFDLNYSNLCAMPDFSFMMYNMFRYYIPATMSANAFEIGDTVQLTARGTELKVTGNGMEPVDFAEGFGEIALTHPGTYTVTQRSMQGETVLVENFFVRIPREESNIGRTEDALPVLNVERTNEIAFEDLLFYFAIALVAFMFAEWYLQAKKNY
ncbi:MAG: VWA domain-containing protein [Ruminococcaceae bacterium]|nr:VWA domain-containing protein [Oscillospiraceae bacterium]